MGQSRINGINTDPAELGQKAQARAAPTRRPPMPVVLVAEDDARMRRYLRATLADQNFRVVDAETGAQALSQASGHNPDLVVLDFELPDFDAIAVTKRLREWTAAPIVVLSVHDAEREKIAVLDAGANDFLSKPFSTGELLARIRVWLRHTQRSEADPLESSLEVGNLRMDFEKRLVTVRGREVRLTPMQYKLLGVMMRHAGKVLTHEQILFMVWGPAYTKETQYLRVYMGKLRQKLEDEPARPRYFITEPGVGYRLRSDV
ncbi:MAG: response regulator [Polyangiaceae bacterium]|nr:response regulator [Polyangiaceae bacterium]